MNLAAKLQEFRQKTKGKLVFLCISKMQPSFEFEQDLCKKGEISLGQNRYFNGFVNNIPKRNLVTKMCLKMGDLEGLDFSRSKVGLSSE